jgi:hypothetical protein
MQQVKPLQHKPQTILDHRWYQDNSLHILMEVAPCLHRLTEVRPSCRLK